MLAHKLIKKYVNNVGSFYFFIKMFSRQRNIYQNNFLYKTIKEIFFRLT